MKSNSLRFNATAGKDDHPVKLCGEPILRFNDPARDFSDATIWAWGNQGRPIALLSMERYDADGRWACELVSLTSDRVIVDAPDGWRWKPTEPGVEMKIISDASSPAETEVGRLSQMKALARRFAVSEDSPQGDHYELRLMPQPIHRYADANCGIVDGALFVYAYGTNPEAVAIIECPTGNDSKRGWEYGFAPLTTHALTASIDDKPAWSRSAAVGGERQKPYSIYLIDVDR